MDGISARVYEDFEPSDKLVQEPEVDTFVIDLSKEGFKKEHLRVQIDNHGKLRITGERPAGGNKWRRFSKNLQVPAACIIGDVRARFEQEGLLRITMPREQPAGDAGGQDQKDDGAAQKAAAPQAEEKKDHGVQQQQQQDAAASKMSAEEEEKHKSKEGDVGGHDGEAAAASRYGFLRDRRKVVCTVLAVVLVLVGAGLYAFMKPTAETAGDIIGFGFSDN